MLATAPGAVTTSKVAEWISKSGEFEPVRARDVERVFGEWRQFLNQEGGDPPRWRICHTSFLTFLAEEVDLGEFRRAGVAATGAKVRWDA
jgi:hypothetical protein